MTEYQIFNMMYIGFISNAMYFVGMVLLTWLGFRMANNIYNSNDANMTAKLFTSLYCILVAAMMFYTQQIGAAILNTAVDSLQAVNVATHTRMMEYTGHPLSIGGTVQTAFVVLVLLFQLAITWRSK